ncbi:MAG: RNA-binding S4 domain-containing protein [Pseudomonadota bacterium]
MSPGEPPDGFDKAAQGASQVRVDKWLWHARFFKTRSKAAEAVTGGLRINAERSTKPAQSVRPGDVLTFAQGRTVRVIRIEAIATRRGPAPEAQALYTDLAPPEPAAAKPEAVSEAEPEPAKRAPGSGRPTKRERREIDAYRLPRS